IVQAARQNLEDLPTLKKYGMLPQRANVAPQSPQTRPAPPVVSSKVPRPSVPVNTEEKDQSTTSDEDQPPPEPAPDKRAIQFLKGKLLSIDCGQAPAAVLVVAAGAKTIKLRTENYKSLTLIGAEEFSCGWKGRPVAINYKAGGKTDGDLVSLEVQ